MEAVIPAQLRVLKVAHYQAALHTSYLLRGTLCKQGSPSKAPFLGVSPAETLCPKVLPVHPVV